MSLVEEIKDDESKSHRLSPMGRLGKLGARDLVQEARDGQLRRAHCYDAYVTQVLEDLAQRRSVVLFGTAGVGKTAVLHEVAVRIAAGEVTEPVRSARLLQISTSAIMEGARYFGDWEAKLRAIVDALGRLTPAYLYIDNIWNLPQAGVSRDSAENFGTYLKPHIEARRVTLLGECTPANFRRSTQDGQRSGALSDAPELLRLFDLITIEEPSREITTTIARNRAAEVGSQYGIVIDAAAVSRCVELAERFLRHRARPGAALDLLEDAVRPHVPIAVTSLPPAASKPRPIARAQAMATKRQQGVTTYLRQVKDFVTLASTVKATVEGVLMATSWMGGKEILHAYHSLQEGYIALRQAAAALSPVASKPSPTALTQAMATTCQQGATTYLRQANDFVTLASRVKTTVEGVLMATTWMRGKEVLHAYHSLQDGYIALGQATTAFQDAMAADLAPMKARAAQRQTMSPVARTPSPSVTAVHDRPVVDAASVMDTFARKSGLPEALFSDRIPLTRDQVRERIGADVFGQEEAVEAVVERIIAIKADLTDPTRPLGILMFAGPTGSGKTHLAAALAVYLCGDAAALVRLDMSDYRDPAAAAALPDHLADRMGQRLFAVVLLDEIEKAQPAVLDIFLQGFGDGYLRSASGRTVWLRNTVIILTSNLGSDLGVLSASVAGFTPPRPANCDRIGGTEDPAVAAAGREHARLVASIEVAVRTHFRPEWINRIDRIVAFHALDRAALRRIARREIDRALGRGGITRRGYVVRVDDSVLDLLVASGAHPLYGARPLQRAVAELVVAPLAEAIAAAPDRAGGTVVLRVENDQVVLHPRTTGSDPTL